MCSFPEMIHQRLRDRESHFRGRRKNPTPFKERWWWSWGDNETDNEHGSRVLLAAALTRCSCSPRWVWSLVILNHFPGCKKEESFLDWPGDKITSEDWCGEVERFLSYYLPPAAVPGWLVGCTKMCREMISFQLEQMVNKLLFKSTWSGYVWSGRRATNIIIISTVCSGSSSQMDGCLSFDCRILKSHSKSKNNH